MRTVTYAAACTLDGFIAGVDGSMDWLHFSRDAQEVLAEYWATVDAVLMGRRTWEVAVANGGAAAATGGGRATYVFSRTLPGIDQPGVELVRDDAGAFVRALRARPGGGICVMGGGALAASLLAADALDEVGLNVHPVLLGAGVPFLPDAGRRAALELTRSRTLDGGCVLLHYRVRRAEGRPPSA